MTAPIPNSLVLDRAFDEIKYRTNQYEGRLAGNDISSAIDLAKAIIVQLLSLLPKGAQEERAQAVCAKLDFLQNAIFTEVSGLSRKAVEFDQLVEDVTGPTLNSNAIYLELGSYIAWPDEKVENYISKKGIR